MNTKNNLPVFSLELDGEIDETGLVAISIVKNPAIQRSFLKFNDEFKFSIEDERRIIMGAVLIPEQEIYRNTPFECYVKFSENQVEEIVTRFHKTGNGKVTLEHALSVQGADIISLWLSDSQLGIMPPRGFEDLPNKTLYVSYKIQDETLWNSIKQNDFTGFSLEGFFNMLPIKMNRELNAFEILKELKSLFPDL